MSEPITPASATPSTPAAPPTPAPAPAASAASTTPAAPVLTLDAVSQVVSQMFEQNNAKLFEQVKSLIPQPATSAQVAPVNPSAPPAPIDAQTNTEILALKKRNEELDKSVKALQTESQAAKETAVRAKKDSVLAGLVSQVEFVSADSRADALARLDKAIVLNPDNTVVSVDNRTADAFIEEFFTKNAYYLKPQRSQGSGNSGGAPPVYGGKLTGMDSIKIGMTDADAANVLRTIGQHLNR